MKSFEEIGCVVVAIEIARACETHEVSGCACPIGGATATGHFADHDGGTYGQFTPTGDAYLAAHYLHGPGVDEPLVWWTRNPEEDNWWELDLEPYLFLADGLGSITAVMGYESGSAAQTIVASYVYDSFGNQVQICGDLGRLNRYRYTGREWDDFGSDTLSLFGLYYYRARYYDPSTGRFLQEDPIWGSNLYAYVGNNPISFIDPSGNLSLRRWGQIGMGVVYIGGGIVIVIGSSGATIGSGGTSSPVSVPGVFAGLGLVGKGLSDIGLAVNDEDALAHSLSPPGLVLLIADEYGLENTDNVDSGYSFFSNGASCISSKGVGAGSAACGFMVLNFSDLISAWLENIYLD